MNERVVMKKSTTNIFHALCVFTLVAVSIGTLRSLNSSEGDTSAVTTLVDHLKNLYPADINATDMGPQHAEEVLGDDGEQKVDSTKSDLIEFLKSSSLTEKSLAIERAHKAREALEAFLSDMQEGVEVTPMEPAVHHPPAIPIHESIGAPHPHTVEPSVPTEEIEEVEKPEEPIEADDLMMEAETDEPTDHPVEHDEIKVPEVGDLTIHADDVDTSITHEKAEPSTDAIALSSDTIEIPSELLEDAPDMDIEEEEGLDEDKSETEDKEED